MLRFNYQEELADGGDLGGSTEVEEAAPTTVTETTTETTEAPEVTTEVEAKPFYSDLPDDWRKQSILSTGMKEEDEGFDKRMKQLERVSDYGVLAKNYFAAQDKIRNGEVSNGLPENATDEQMTEYREANGIPETAEDYKLELGEGLVLGEVDERIMKNVFDVAHGDNIPSETMSKITNAVLEARQVEAQAMIDKDGVDQISTDKLLRETWGQNTEANRNMVQGLINQLPETVRESFMSARMPDGRAVFNTPEIMVAMAEWSAKINPAATVVPNSNNPVASIDAEIKALESRMGGDDWHSDDASQARYQKLIEAKDNMQ